MKDGNRRLQKYLKEYWEFILRHNPTFATYIGDHRYDDALEDLSEESASAQIDYFKDLSARIGKIDKTSLTRENTLNQKLIQRTLSNHIRMYRFKTRFMALDHLRGPHIDFPQIIEFHPFKTRRDIEHYISRLHAFAPQIDQVIENLQKGVRHKITAFKNNMEHAIKQIETFTQCKTEEHPLYTPVMKLSDDFSSRQRDALSSSVREAISSFVTPAYKKLHQYISRKYMKHCRAREGIWSLPDGADMYRFFIQYHTTTDLSPEEIHDIGKDEVKNIKNEMKEIMRKTGFTGNTRGFADHVKKKKDLYPESGQEILEGYRELLARMDRGLPDYFGRLPKAKYDIKEIEQYREQAAPAAYYYPPPRDFSRPGYFYVNTYKPGQRPLFVMEALLYHEAVPGHHLQIAIMQEQEDMPDFRRYEGATAFIEGWALYAERLAREMGFYRDDFSEYGRLTFALWRAVRLVVDTGLHRFRWGRDKSIQYCRENTGLEEHEIEVEVDRYIAMPGQALSYKIGEMKIIELRDKARDTLGAAFKIREFHDRLLENGALPLFELERVMEDWMVRA
jgi:uncharacterized protein (DUF885 family)